MYIPAMCSLSVKGVVEMIIMAPLEPHHISHLDMCPWRTFGCHFVGPGTPKSVERHLDIFVTNYTKQSTVRATIWSSVSIVTLI